MPAGGTSGVQGQGQGKGGGNKRRASLVATFDDTLLEASATHPITGGGDDILGGLALAGRASLLLVGTLELALDSAYVVGAGTPVATASFEAALDDAAVSATAIHLSELALAQVLAAATLSAAGGPVVAASLSSTLRSSALNGFGIQTPSQLVLNTALDDATLDDAEGVLLVSAALDAQLDDAALSAHSPFAARAGVLDATLNDTMLAVGGGPVASAALTQALSDMTASAGGRGTAGASVLQALDDLALDAQAVELAAASAAIVLERARSSAAGAVTITAQLIAQLTDAVVLAVPEVSPDRGDVVTRAERIDTYSRRRADEEAFA